MLSGILHPTSGHAVVNGFVPWERKNAFKKHMTIVLGQKSQLWWDLPAIESINLNRHIYEIDDKEYHNTLNELCELLKVKELLNVQVRRLSLGEKMKMELVASLIHKPQIVFLDEPTIGLDFVSQIKIRDFLKNYNQYIRATIIITSHNMSDIQNLCPRIIIVNDGTIVYDGELQKIKDSFGCFKLIKLRFSDAVSEHALRRYGNMRSYHPFSAVLEADRARVNQITQEMAHVLPICDMNIEDIPIEEYISRMYEREGDGKHANELA
jgi:ABC-2 type transport system ATP-binding protein